MPLITQGKTNWKFILIVAVLAIFVGAMVLVYVNNFNSDLTLLSFFQEIKNKIPEMRVLMDQKTWEEHWNSPIDFGEKFNTDYPITNILYSNPDKGISLYLSYNQKWGTEKYKILPYYKASCPSSEFMEQIYTDNPCIDGISFGPPCFFQDNYWILFRKIFERNVLFTSKECRRGHGFFTLFPRR